MFFRARQGDVLTGHGKQTSEQHHAEAIVLNFGEKAAPETEVSSAALLEELGDFSKLLRP